MSQQFASKDAQPTAFLKRRSSRAIARAASASHTNHFESLEGRQMMSATNPLSSPNTVTATVFRAVGTVQVAAAVKAFEAAIGGADNTLNPVQQTSGFRTINWDGVLLDGTDFAGQTRTLVPNKDVAIPENRFQSRGALFDEIYVVSGDGFTALNPGVGGQLNAFSPKNTFGHFNDVDLGTKFIRASAPTSAPVQQATRGFGAVFLDVEKANSSNIEFQNGTESLGKFFAPAGPSGQPEFLGVLFSAPVVTHVDVNPGESALFNLVNGHITAGEKDLSNGGTKDMAAVDDFIYGEPVSPVKANVIHATEGKLFSNTVTTFHDNNPFASASQHSALINWGDGTTSNGLVQGSNGTFTVKGNHVYREEGSFRVSVQIRDQAGHTVRSSAIADVADAPIAATGQNFSASHTLTFNGQVAKMSDANLLNLNPADYTGTIDWGDGVKSAASFVRTSAGQWSVRGVHKYSHAGTFNVKVSIQDIGGSVASALSKALVI